MIGQSHMITLKLLTLNNADKPSDKKMFIELLDIERDVKSGILST